MDPRSQKRVVVVVGHPDALEHPDGPAVALRQLGSDVVTMGFWDDPYEAALVAAVVPRVLVFESGDRPDWAVASMRALRAQETLAQVPSLLAVPERQVARIEPSTGFDDFIVAPYFPAELYARIRALEWRASEFTNDERLKIGGLVIDRAAHEVFLEGARVPLTAKEFALLVFLCNQRGKVFSRQTLLARVWGARYEGGPRTVDIHVRRLRAKLGDALPLETLRGAGYKLKGPPAR